MSDAVSKLVQVRFHVVKFKNSFCASLFFACFYDEMCFRRVFPPVEGFLAVVYFIIYLASSASNKCVFNEIMHKWRKLNQFSYRFCQYSAVFK